MDEKISNGVLDCVPYELCYNELISKGEKEMSFVVASMNKYGIVMTSDTKETVGDGKDSRATGREVRKIVRNERCVVGFAGIQKIPRANDEDFETDVLVEKALRKVDEESNPDEIALLVKKTFSESGFASVIPRNERIDLIVGCRNGRSDFRYSLGTYSLINGNLLRPSTTEQDGKPRIEACGTIHCFPYDLVRSQNDWSESSISELKNMNERILDCVLKVGIVYEKAGLISYFPVGCKTKPKTTFFF